MAVDIKHWELRKRVLIAGLKRFQDEGMTSWSAADLEKAFHPYSITDPLVIDEICRWHSAGAVRASWDAGVPTIEVVDLSKL